MKKVWVLLLAAVLLLSGCDKKADVDTTVEYMESQTQLQFWGKDSETALEQVQNLLAELEKEWSWSSADSIMPYMELYGLQTDHVQYEEDPVTGVVIEVPGTGAAYDFTLRQAEVAEKALALCLRTDGAYDPQVYDLVKLWGFAGDNHQVPSREEAENTAQLSQWELDSAIKGYAGTQAVKCLQELQIEGALLNMGGVVQTYGTKDGKAWRIGVRDPRDAGTSICTVEVSDNACVATTAVYQKCFEQNGQTYHDVLDPLGGYPVNNGIASVTVICADGMTADCLSNGLFVMGYEMAVEHWKESSDFEMVIVMTDGKVCATEGVKLYKSSAEMIQR